MTREQAEAKGRELIKNKTAKELCEMFIITNNKSGSEIPMVRGWIMDRLEEINEQAFCEWIDTENVSLMDNPTSFFVKA